MSMRATCKGEGGRKLCKSHCLFSVKKSEPIGYYQKVRIFKLVEMVGICRNPLQGTPRQGSGRFDDQMRLQKSHFLQAPSICASALTEGENAARRIKACSEKARRNGENRSGFPVFHGNSQASPAENFVNFPRTNLSAATEENRGMFPCAARGSRASSHTTQKGTLIRCLFCGGDGRDLPKPLDRGPLGRAALRSHEPTRGHASCSFRLLRRAWFSPISANKKGSPFSGSLFPLVECL